MLTILPKNNTRSRQTPAGYTLRVLKSEESDQSGAVPGEERHARRGSGAEAEAEIAAGAVMGKVHATSVGAGIDRLVCDRAGTMVTGTDSGSVAVGVTQQSI
ncbi:MAG: hypothetical protein V9H26_11870 [Verrucomicrobiota bacterium]